jgi:hypothetical protein
LIGEVFAEGEAGPANGAKHVAAVGEFFDAHLFAESDVSELATGWALDVADLEFATGRGLTESQGGVTFKIDGESRHRCLGVGKLIETVSQQQNEDLGGNLSKRVS